MWRSHRETGTINLCYMDIATWMCTPSSDAAGLVINSLDLQCLHIMRKRLGSALSQHLPLNIQIWPHIHGVSRSANWSLNTLLGSSSPWSSDPCKSRSPGTHLQHYIFRCSPIATQWAERAPSFPEWGYRLTHPASPAFVKPVTTLPSSDRSFIWLPCATSISSQLRKREGSAFTDRT